MTYIQDTVINWIPTIASLGVATMGGARMGGATGAGIALSASILDETLLYHQMENKHYFTASLLWSSVTCGPIAKLFPQHDLLTYPACIALSSALAYGLGDFLDYKTKMEYPIKALTAVHQVLTTEDATAEYYASVAKTNIASVASTIFSSWCLSRYAGHTGNGHLAIVIKQTAHAETFIWDRLKFGAPIVAYITLNKVIEHIASETQKEEYVLQNTLIRNALNETKGININDVISLNRDAHNITSVVDTTIKTLFLLPYIASAPLNLLFYAVSSALVEYRCNDNTNSFNKLCKELVSTMNLLIDSIAFSLPFGMQNEAFGQFVIAKAAATSLIPTFFTSQENISNSTQIEAMHRVESWLAGHNQINITYSQELTEVIRVMPIGECNNNVSEQIHSPCQN